MCFLHPAKSKHRNNVDARRHMGGRYAGNLHSLGEMEDRQGGQTCSIQAPNDKEQRTVGEPCQVKGDGAGDIEVRRGAE